MSIAEIVLGVGLIVAGLNFILPPKTVKKLRLDKVQEFLEFLKSTGSGTTIKKGE